MKRKVVAIAITLGAAAFFLSRFAGGEPESKGRTLYLRYCSSCHGPTGKGDGLLAEAMKAKIPNLTKIAARRKGVFPNEEIARIIDGRQDVTEHGTRRMPIWGTRLFDEAPFERPHQKEAHVDNRVRSLVHYLRKIQTK